MRSVVALALFAVCISSARAQHIAPTPHLPPDKAKGTFKLPPGFEVQLVAAEPDILKPMNIAFDTKGRLWATVSQDYPFAAKPGQGKDKVIILEDFAPDGKARKITTFAEGLSIPIGVLPLPDAKSVLVFSPPTIWKFTDTDGDGIADKKEEILTGFGFKDTHGMTNSFLMGTDGWVYACHGFSNDTRVRAKDGSEIHMLSGNTYRFRPDGSRVEAYTRGQVNPFGMTNDPWGNFYTADCHSKPITQILPGAYYSSFGKPHDGLGYGPDMINHDHGSTALCGLTWNEADHFPKEYNATMFLGNVVTNRINFDHIVFQGSTPKAIQNPDFMTSSDPWFRPVDVRLSPDGSLYVADFYNSVIGHYEVPLDHPARDRKSGRIWRIVWKGLDGKAPAPRAVRDCTTASADELVADLDSPNIVVRDLAGLSLIARKDSLRTDLSKSIPAKPTSRQKALLIAVRQQYGQLDDEALAKYAIDADPLVRAHVLRAIAWRMPQTGASAEIVRNYLGDKDPMVAKVAAEVAGMLPAIISWKDVVGYVGPTPPQDTHLLHTRRIALRNLLASQKAIDVSGHSLADIKACADVALGIPTAVSAEFLRGSLDKLAAEPRLGEWVEHVARYGKPEKLSEDLTSRIEGIAGTDRRRAVGLLRSLYRGLESRGLKPSAPTSKLTVELVSKVLSQEKDPGAIQTALDCASSARLSELLPALSAFVARTDRVSAQRLAGMMPIIATDAVQASALLTARLKDPKELPDIRSMSAVHLANINRPENFQLLGEVLTTAPAALSSGIALALAGQKAGAEKLLSLIETGKASPRLLADRVIAQKVRDSKPEKADSRMAALTKNLPGVDARINGIIAARVKSYAASAPDLKRGEELFKKNCAACHQVGGQGAKIGPQLDGIGIRGPERLMEDIMDPSRNVDAAFRMTTLVLKDGKSLSGLLLREEGEIAVLADLEGKEQRVAKGDIEEKRGSVLSPMPANFADTMKEDEFRDMLGWLLTRRQ